MGLEFGTESRGSGVEVSRVRRSFSPRSLPSDPCLDLVRVSSSNPPCPSCPSRQERQTRIVRQAVSVQAVPCSPLRPSVRPGLPFPPCPRRSPLTRPTPPVRPPDPPDQKGRHRAFRGSPTMLMLVGARRRGLTRSSCSSSFTRHDLLPSFRLTSVHLLSPHSPACGMTPVLT